MEGRGDEWWSRGCRGEVEIKGESRKVGVKGRREGGGREEC